MLLMNAHAVIFTMRLVYVHVNNTVISLCVYKHKQDVGNIGVWDQFL